MYGTFVLPDPSTWPSEFQEKDKGIGRIRRDLVLTAGVSGGGADSLARVAFCSSSVPGLVLFCERVLIIGMGVWSACTGTVPALFRRPRVFGGVEAISTVA